MNVSGLGIDWVAMAILATAYIFSRIPGVNLRLGNAAVAVACGIIAYRYYDRWVHQPLQLNLIMMGLAIALALYYLTRAITAGGSKRGNAPPPEDEE